MSYDDAKHLEVEIEVLSDRLKLTIDQGTESMHAQVYALIEVACSVIDKSNEPDRRFLREAIDETLYRLMR